MSRLGDWWYGREAPEPTEGTEESIWPQVANFWAETFETNGLYISPSTAEKVWVANRCIQLNAQQISSMPLRFGSSAPGGGYEPAWVSSPDPVWFPNGIGDALFALVGNLYRWGFSIQLVTSRYSNGVAQSWTVLDSRYVTIEIVRGRRSYKNGDKPLNSEDVVQIDRNPGNALHGTSAIEGYASQAWSLIASGELGRGLMSGGVPTTVLKPKRKQTEAQARKLQTQWMAATARRGGAPPVLPPDIDWEALSISPKDLLLLEGQEFNSRVVASAYGCPPFLLNLPLSGGLTYQNPEKLGEFWWRFELRPMAKRIADAFTAQMLPRGNWVTLDASDTMSPLTPDSSKDDPQLSDDVVVDESAVADASPADQNRNGNGTRMEVFA